MSGQTDGAGPGGAGPGGTEPVGSVAEEAAKLIGALSGWAREHGDGLSSFAEGLDDHVATGSAECAWCPVCRTVAAVRQTSPDVVAHLGSAASSLMLALSGLVAPHSAGGSGGVERIPLDDEWPEGEG